ncbi:hypothetical protein PM082_014680 [Marasmius tenuissimus]|nr:hypothetical protein PM082_014680 [Marasmius tenuissimus]
MQSSPQTSSELFEPTSANNPQISNSHPTAMDAFTSIYNFVSNTGKDVDDVPVLEEGGSSGSGSSCVIA